jgi:hypothetical protein
VFPAVACTQFTDIAAAYGHITEFCIWCNPSIFMGIFLVTCLEKIMDTQLVSKGADLFYSDIGQYAKKLFL